MIFKSAFLSFFDSIISFSNLFKFLTPSSINFVFPIFHLGFFDNSFMFFLVFYFGFFDNFVIKFANRLSNFCLVNIKIHSKKEGISNKRNLFIIKVYVMSLSKAIYPVLHKLLHKYYVVF